MATYPSPRVFPSDLQPDRVRNGDIPKYSDARVIEDALRHLLGMGHHHPTLFAFEDASGAQPIEVAASENWVIPIRVPPFARHAVIALLVDGPTPGATYAPRVLIGSAYTDLVFRGTGSLDVGTATWTRVAIMDAADGTAGSYNDTDATLIVNNQGSGTIYVFACDLLWRHNTDLEV